MSSNKGRVPPGLELDMQASRPRGLCMSKNLQRMKNNEGPLLGQLSSREAKQDEKLSEVWKCLEEFRRVYITCPPGSAPILGMKHPVLLKPLDACNCLLLPLQVHHSLPCQGVIAYI